MKLLSACWYVTPSVVNGNPRNGHWSPPRAEKSVVATLTGGPGRTMPFITTTVPSSSSTCLTRVPGVITVPSVAIRMPVPLVAYWNFIPATCAKRPGRDHGDVADAAAVDHPDVRSRLSERGRELAGLPEMGVRDEVAHVRL